MLDDLKAIHNRDSADALGIVSKQGQQLILTMSGGLPAKIQVDNIVYAGMGGSALAALLVPGWPGLNTPFELVRDYDIPAYVGASTLFIAASYSGNTEETLNAVAQAQARGAQIAIIAGGGQLQALAEAERYPLLTLPKTAQPRYGTLANVRAVLILLAQAGLIVDASTELAAAANFLASSVKPWVPEIATAHNPAKQLAQELMGKSIVLYSGPKLYPAAYKWKISCNENAKHLAWVGQYPEFNHNEFIGWSGQPVSKPYAVIDIQSNLEHAQVQKRFALSQRLLSGKRPQPFVVVPLGDTLLQQVLWTMAYGDFVSIYLALLNGVDPAPVALVEKFKQELAL
jgi:glucose/mannose-6-phosphate isomerase